MKSVKLTCENGYSYKTAVSEKTTYSNAVDYFVGQPVRMESFQDDWSDDMYKISKIVSVELLPFKQEGGV